MLLGMVVIIAGIALLNRGIRIAAEDGGVLTP
jgi:hypothetical protein